MATAIGGRDAVDIGRGLAATLYTDGSGVIWRIDSGQPVAQLTPGTEAADLGDGRALTMRPGGGLSVWDIQSGQGQLDLPGVNAGTSTHDVAGASGSAGSAAPPKTPPTSAAAGLVGSLDFGKSSLNIRPEYAKPLGDSKLAPGYIKGSGTYNQWKLDQPGLFNAAGTLNMQYGSGSIGDPTNGTERQTDAKWTGRLGARDQRAGGGGGATGGEGGGGMGGGAGSAFIVPSGQNLEGEWAPLGNMIGRTDTETGISTSAANAPPELYDLLYKAIKQGIVQPQALGWQFLQETKGVTPQSLGVTAAPGAGTPAAPGASTIPEGGSFGGPLAGAYAPMQGGLPGGAGLEWWSLYYEHAQDAANEAVKQAELSGQFNGMDTLAKQQLSAQIAQNAANNELQRRLADETIRKADLDEAYRRDQLAQQIKTTGTQLQQAQQALDDAKAAGDANRVQQAEQFLQTLQLQRDAQLQSAQQFGATFAENQRQFNVTQGETTRQNDLNESFRRDQLAEQIRTTATQLQQAQQSLDDARANNDANRVQQMTQFIQTLQQQQAEQMQQAQQFGQTFAEQQRQYNATQAQQQSQFNTTASGYMQGADGTQTPTMAREQMLYQQQQDAYARAANPARSFENELARGATGQNGPVAAAAGLVAGGGPVATGNGATGAGAAPAAAGAAGTPAAGGDYANAPVRTPAVVNAFRQGAAVPTAGNFGVDSTTGPASQAALGEGDFRMQNQGATNRLNPIQKLIVGSYGTAGGVDQSMQDWWKAKGTPKQNGVAGSYAL